MYHHISNKKNSTKPSLTSYPTDKGSINPSAQEAWFDNLQTALENLSISQHKQDISHQQAFNHFKHYVEATRTAKGTVWLLGNGGSIATCSHIAQDMMNRLQVRTETLNNGPLITCISNDYAFEQTFLKPFQAHAQTEDTLILLSCSGESRNIVSTAECAKKLGIKLIVLSAKNITNTLNRLDADLSFWVATQSYGIAEVAHHAILHNYVETMADAEQEESKVKHSTEYDEGKNQDKNLCSLA